MKVANPLTSNHDRRPAWGQVALGVCGAWEVAVDEAVDGPQRWLGQIDGPDVSLTFELESPVLLEQAVKLLGAGSRPCAASESLSGSSQACDTELELGRLAGCGVRLIRDTESTDRCFVLIHAPGAGSVRVVLANESLRQFSEALAHAAEELASAGLITVPSS